MMAGTKPPRPPPQFTFGNRGSYESKAKGVSMSASILTILIYISVFYIFDLSPSIVLNSSKFWFFISNTLIIIIAADYGSFSSSCDKVDDDHYDEYVATTSRQTMSPVYHQRYYTHTIPIIPSYTLHVKNTLHGEEINEDEDGVVEVKNVIFSTLIEVPKEEEEDIAKEIVVDETWKVPTQDSIWETISKDTDNKVQKENASRRSNINHVDEDRKKVKRFRRTVSEKLPKPTHHERKKVIHRWESERHEPLVAENEEQVHEKDDPFSTMTDEELNRRVEDFIQKFNRHIRHERSINF